MADVVDYFRKKNQYDFLSNLERERLEEINKSKTQTPLTAEIKGNVVFNNPLYNCNFENMGLVFDATGFVGRIRKSDYDKLLGDKKLKDLTPEQVAMQWANLVAVAKIRQKNEGAKLVTPTFKKNMETEKDVKRASDSKVSNKVFNESSCSDMGRVLDTHLSTIDCRMKKHKSKAEFLATLPTSFYGTAFIKKASVIDLYKLLIIKLQERGLIPGPYNKTFMRQYREQKEHEELINKLSVDWEELNLFGPREKN